MRAEALALLKDGMTTAMLSPDEVATDDRAGWLLRASQSFVLRGHRGQFRLPNPASAVRTWARDEQPAPPSTLLAHSSESPRRATSRAFVFSGRRTRWPEGKLAAVRAELGDWVRRQRAHAGRDRGGARMIVLTKLNGPSFALNPDLIERVDADPGTVIIIVGGASYPIAESVDELLERVRDYRGQVIATAHAVEFLVEQRQEPAPPSATSGCFRPLSPTRRASRRDSLMPHRLPPLPRTSGW